MEILLFAIGIAILGYLAFVFLFPKALPDESSKHTKQVLQDIYDSTMSAEASSGDQAQVLKDEFAEENPLVKTAYSLPFMSSLYEAVIQAGHQKQALLIVFALIGLTLLFFSIALSGGFGPMSVILAPVFAYLLVRHYFRRKVRKRNEAFIYLFPDVLDMIVRSVRSGFPTATAFKMVAENMEEPVKSEFQQVVNEIAMGRTMNDALSRLAARINEPDINFFVVVLNVQQETGGNLAEVITNLSNIIRKRKQLRMKIRAMTSEGRATAVILGSLPFFIFFVLYFIRRDYLEPLWTEPSGQMLLASAIGLVMFCMFIVSRMIDIDI